QGFFFANVQSLCSVNPPLSAENGPEYLNGTQFLCSALSSADLSGREVTVTYKVDPDRRLKLSEIRLRGTNLFTIDEIRSVLESKQA
ncbi:hypothetical protein OFM36_34685, partial [Escherichia coli]|nr:hypothetical protein [Escherichia coli]